MHLKERKADPGHRANPSKKTARQTQGLESYFHIHFRFFLMDQSKQSEKFTANLSAMPVRFQHDRSDHSIYFVTFTCIKWKHLFEISGAYEAVYKWFDTLFERNIKTLAYVVMPNHLHSLIYFSRMPTSLNTIIGNAKRFMAYRIVKGLEERNEIELLEELNSFVKENERKKGQRHKIFEDSFDAKQCYSTKLLFQKLDYIHKNPVSKKWRLVDDYTDYEHSSAAFYERGLKRYKKLFHVGELL
jgi:putative transposase